MKRRWIEFDSEWARDCPMSFWVHRPVDGTSWARSEEFDPTTPSVVPGKGYPVYFVEFDGFVFKFSSLAEINVCIDTLGQKNLPNVHPECEKRGVGPVSHWLNRLPAHVLPWKYREKAVKYLAECRDHFQGAGRP